MLKQAFICLTYISLAILVALPCHSAGLSKQTPAPAEEYVIDPSQILQLNQEMKNLVDLFVKPIHSKEQRARALLDLMFNESKMDIRYHFFGTKTSVETINSGVGNCLSLANAYIAMARYAGLDARFLSVHLPDNWLEIDEYFYLTKHTTAAVKLSRTKIATIEFTGISYGIREQGDFISDGRGFAEYYSNIGIEYFRQGNFDAAVQNLKQAIAMDKDYPHAWNNLGVVYKRQGKLNLAEEAYKAALNIDRKSLSTLNNLATLYKEIGDNSIANKYSRRLERYRRQNPYYLGRLAERALENKDYSQAASLAKQAIRKQSDEHRFYFIATKAYFLQGKHDSAEKYLRKAIKFANSESPRSRYERKLKLLQQHTGNPVI